MTLKYFADQSFLTHEYENDYKTVRSYEEDGKQLTSDERYIAMLSLQSLKKGAAEGKVSVDTLYNAAAVAGRLNLGMIQNELMGYAAKLDPSSKVTEARY